MKIYVASSWRNEYQPVVVDNLRAAGHEVYDFKDPKAGFHWSQLDPEWLSWTPEKFRASLDHELARRGFKSDLDAMEWADACVLVLPSGRSAHAEAGWFAGRGKPVHVVIPTAVEPELMYKLFTSISVTGDELLAAIEAGVPGATHPSVTGPASAMDAPKAVQP